MRRIVVLVAMVSLCVSLPAQRISDLLKPVPAAISEEAAMPEAMQLKFSRLQKERHEKFITPETRVVKGKLQYRRVAVLKPVRNHIWDNRFNALIENDKDGETQGTLFKLDTKNAGASIYPGMLIRQING